MISLGMVDVDDEAVLADAREWDRECNGDSASGYTAVPGIFLDAAVDGLISCSGEGCRLMETDWMAEASSDAGLLAIVVWSEKREIGMEILMSDTWTAESRSKE